MFGKWLTAAVAIGVLLSGGMGRSEAQQPGKKDSQKARPERQTKEEPDRLKQLEDQAGRLEDLLNRLDPRAKSAAPSDSAKSKLAADADWKRLDEVLHHAALEGTILFNTHRPNAALQLYRGTLIASLPTLRAKAKAAADPAQAKGLADLIERVQFALALTGPELLPTGLAPPADPAWGAVHLRMALNDIRNEPYRYGSDDDRRKTLIRRLGGELAVRGIMASTMSASADGSGLGLGDPFFGAGFRSPWLRLELLGVGQRLVIAMRRHSVPEPEILEVLREFREATDSGDLFGALGY